MSSAGIYQVGAATVDITPALDKPVYLAGFAPNRKARSVLHPLTAGVMVVKDEDGGLLALITLDLIGFMNPFVQRIKIGLEGVIPADRIVVASTHTHAGPDTMGLWGKTILGFIPVKSGVDPDYIDLVVHKVVQGVHQAIKESVPVSLSAVTFDAPEHLVRNDRKGGGSYPRSVALIASQKDSPEVLLLNFAAHPETLWQKNHQVSPDYPACYREHLKELGVETPLFFSGPLGAMLTPNVNPKATLDEREQYINEMGRELAEHVFKQISRAEPLSGPIKVAHKKLSMLNTNGRFNLARKFKIFERDIVDNRIESEMVLGSIGSFRFTTIPGEPCPEVGDALYEALGEGHRMIFALGMDEVGYIIPSDFFSIKEYKYETTMSLGPHMASEMVDNVKALLQELPE